MGFPGGWGFPVAQMVKHLPAMREAWVWSLGLEDPLEKELSTHSSIFAWKIPWTEEPGRLQSIGLQNSCIWLSNYTRMTTICVCACYTFINWWTEMLFQWNILYNWVLLFVSYIYIYTLYTSVCMYIHMQTHTFSYLYLLDQIEISHPPQCRSQTLHLIFR